MPSRVTTASSSPARSSSPTPRAPKADTAQVSRGWSARGTRAGAETTLDRWSRLRQPVIEPVKVHTASVTDEAKRFAKDMKLTPREAQNMLDELQGIALADPMWPHFKGMGFNERDAYMLRQSLRDSENGGRTSIAQSIGTEGVAKHAPKVEQLSALVEALTAGKPGTKELAALQGPQGEVLRRAPADALLQRATALLENELSNFLTDSPVDLVDAAPNTVKRGLLAVIGAETKQLGTADAADLRKATHDGFSSIPLLRELTVLDPNAARVAGAMFADALHAAQQR